MDDVGAPERFVLRLMRAARWLGRLLRGRVVEFVGGPARARVIVLFGCVLALNSAQVATVGAVAPQLESSLHIGNTKIGLLNSVALLVAPWPSIPVGMLVDRVRRVPMLAGSIVLWSVATLLGGAGATPTTACCSPASGSARSPRRPARRSRR